MRIVTECICPSIPIRTFDWCALDADTYDMTDIDGETGRPYSTHPVGYGATEQEAVNDFLEKVKETEEQANE